MSQHASSSQPVKAGNGHAAATARRDVFVNTYIANGNNATQAAITAGYSAKTAYSQGQRLLKNADISRQIARAAQRVAEITGLTAERTIGEIARICTFDIRRLYREDGTLKHVTEMDEDTRAAIASIEVHESVVDGIVVGQTTKIKPWDKIRALEMAMKHLALYERNHAQQRENLKIQVVLV